MFFVFNGFSLVLVCHNVHFFCVFVCVRVCLSLSLIERHLITFSVVRLLADMKGTFQKETCSGSFNFEYSFQSFKFWMVYI